MANIRRSFFWAPFWHHWSYFSILNLSVFYLADKYFAISLLIIFQIILSLRYRKTRKTNSYLLCMLHYKYILYCICITKCLKFVEPNMHPSPFINYYPGGAHARKRPLPLLYCSDRNQEQRHAASHFLHTSLPCPQSLAPSL